MWHARCLAAAGPRLNKQAAWMVARLARHPDEHAYALAHPDTYALAIAHLEELAHLKTRRR